MPKITRPTSLSEYAEVTLRSVADAGLGQKLSLGGALGLQHYLEYRSTHDVDAWWHTSTSSLEREQVFEAVEEILRPFGPTRRRQWGDVTSLELLLEGKVVFSFQVAERSAQIEPTATLPWLDFAIDSLPDLIASKMVALVERGAPRDFLDIYTLCQREIVTPTECWRLWKERQERAESDASPDRARLAVESHLGRIVRHRPLESIADPDQRRSSETLRSFFGKEFLHALVA
ncbi:MAG TPA: nucleotidyl transferase AbiEii/AbiGii toxin family protein [Thermoanaerobaculia bacterium]|jgi:hypothetical protein|nr:nucleotidyl transferase AbiEii/AbiGii toxin family protein [Thermoanaerobaculia bacterium]